MKIKFDKVYCISYCRNIEKQNNMRKLMKYLGIDFKFIYGADYTNFNIFKHKDFHFLGGTEDFRKETDFKYYTHFIGASYDHYTAILHAYESGANSVLIMEDDCAFINNIQYINYHLNKYPKDADIVNFGYFMCSDVSQEELNSKKGTYISEYADKYSGSQLYGLCNRETMKHYIDYQQNNFMACDLVFYFIQQKHNLKNYVLTKPLALDGFSVSKNPTFQDKYNLINHIK